MTTALAFTDDVLLFVDPPKGCLRKHLNRHLFGYSMAQLVDDDQFFSTCLFDATPHDLVRIHRRSRTRSRV